ncbi:hypothetical protein BGZ83_011641 [Gryganskiella cystojenkinii]|nr:hypothetical protein BGZ83_011641 [Gryganskiella cystojenkinii]
MLSYVLPGLLTLASGVLADVTYNVIAFPDRDNSTFGVSLNGEIIKLTTTPSTFPLWSGTVKSASTLAPYQYVQISAAGSIEKEQFTRSFDHHRGGNKTPNEFFGRQHTYTNLPKIPQVFPDVRPRPSRGFDDSQIATIHITADPVIFADMVANPLDTVRKPIDAKFRFINADTVYTADSVKVKVSGHGSRKYQKLSLRINLAGTNGDQHAFFNRPIIKLRSETSDPAFIREKLYFDALNSVGVPTVQGSYARVYVNKKPFGFHLMIEDIDNPFLRTTMQHDSPEPKELGSLYQMGSHILNKEATMLYEGPKTANYDPGVYTNKNLGNNPKAEPMTQLIDFFKDLQEFDPSLPGGIKFWNSRLDLEGFLRYTAMEYLGGNWDAYWWKGNNFFFYYNPTQARWQFIPTDFDSTFNDGNREDVSVTYKNFAASRLGRPGKDHPLITKLIFENEEINARFEQILLSIVQKIFNSKVLYPRIDAYETMIQDDVKWDLSISRSSNPGKPTGFTINDFHDSINKGVKDIKFGIKPWILERERSVPEQVSKN